MVARSLSDQVAFAVQSDCVRNLMQITNAICIDNVRGFTSVV